VHENTRISAAEIGVLATVGKSVVKVAKQPKVMIVSTGDELVGVDEIPLAHQIRRSNVFTLVSLLEKLNIASETAHITDDKPILKSKIETYLQAYDVLLFSGAVSKGKYDFLPEVFEELGVEKLFHKVTQRPGKPFWFGRATSLRLSEQHVYQNENKQTIVFGFPGNPISTFVNCLAYFYPWYYQSVGLEMEEETAILGEDVNFRPNLTYFLQVKLENKKGCIVALPILGNGSGDLASLAKTAAFIQLPEDKLVFKKGEVFKIIRYR
jgi:molybdopterin molybdotransferase